MSERPRAQVRPGPVAAPSALLLASLLLVACTSGAGSPAPSIPAARSAAATSLASPAASPSAGPSSSYDRLCELSRRYSSDPDTAEAMCDQLATAERSEAEGNLKAEYRALDAFRAAVEAERGTSLEVGEANDLMELLDRL